MQEKSTTFQIRCYTKKELALCYFPATSNPHTAVNHLMAWIRRCRPLSAALAEAGYEKSVKVFSPKEVRLIVEYLGAP